MPLKYYVDCWNDFWIVNEETNTYQIFYDSGRNWSRVCLGADDLSYEVLEAKEVTKEEMFLKCL